MRQAAAMSLSTFNANFESQMALSEGDAYTHCNEMVGTKTRQKPNAIMFLMNA